MTDMNLMSAKDVAQLLGYAPEYVAHLCRSGQLEAMRDEGGSWLINRESAEAYKRTATEAKELRAKHLSRQRRKEGREQQKESSLKKSFPSRAFAALAIFALLTVGAGAVGVASHEMRDSSAAMAAIDSAFFGGNPFEVFGKLFSFFAGAPSPAPVATSPASSQEPAAATTSVANNYVSNTYTTNNNTYHTTNNNTYTTTVAGITSQDLDAKINSLRSEVYAVNGSYAQGGFTSNIALAQRIDNLANVTISNGTVHGLAGLTNSDIPDDITASNYLPLSGGTIAGDLTITGTCTGCGIGGGGSLFGQTWEITGDYLAPHQHHWRCHRRIFDSAGFTHHYICGNACYNNRLLFCHRLDH